MQRRSPARRVRRGLLPGARSPRTATLVSLDAESAALRELREALSRAPREIPSKYFYDDAGSALFEQITRLPEYFPTATERALLEARAAALVESAGGRKLTDVVELGSGAASKTVALLDAALAAGGRPKYVAVDISAHALQRTKEILAAARPEIPVEHVLADYTQALQLPPKPAGGRRLVLFLGGTIGNDEDEAAVKFLSRVREHMEQDDLLLLGANLITDPAALHLAYNDPQGITAAFNRNVLRNVNSFVRSNFDAEKFAHYAPYVVERGDGRRSRAARLDAPARPRRRHPHRDLAPVHPRTSAPDDRLGRVHAGTVDRVARCAFRAGPGRCAHLAAGDLTP